MLGYCLGRGFVSSPTYDPKTKGLDMALVTSRKKRLPFPGHSAPVQVRLNRG